MTASLLGACGTDDSRVAQFSGVAASETLYFSGNEPFWSGETAGTSLRYTTPENLDGASVVVRRFAGNEGLGVSGILNDAPFDMVITPGRCLDTMADRAYPYVVTLMIDGDLREGCGWTDRQPYSATTAG